MAEEMRTVRVSGLPVNMSENRLSDKLHIHFLRKKNGGGEISSVTISKSSPGTAFITFEESEAALRLAKQRKQVFKVNEKNYDITISLQNKEVDPNEVILQMSVIVDYSKLPEGKRTLLSLKKTFPDVQLNFDAQTNICTLNGLYTDIQSFSSLILRSLESQKPNSGDGLLSMTERNGKYSLPLEKNDNITSGTDEETGVVKSQHAQQTEEFNQEMENTINKTGQAQSISYVHQVSHEVLMDDRWEPDDGTSFEDFSLVVDSDIFRYLHTNCAKEYQSILRQHRVEVLDVTSQDITTLYLKSKKPFSEGGMSSVKRAHKDLAHLYQVKGSQLRKEYVSKSGIPKNGLEHALESLKQRLPKLMIDEEEGNVYLVGSKSDVSEAKQFITDVKGIRTDKESHSDPLFPPPQSTYSFSNHGGSVSSQLLEQSDIFRPFEDKILDSDVLFQPREDYQKSKREEIYGSNETKHTFDQHTYSTPFTMQAQNKAMTNEDIFYARRIPDTSGQEHIQSFSVGWYDKDKYTDSLFVSAKPSSTFSTMDLDKKPIDNADLISEETKVKHHPDTKLNGLEKQLKSSGGHKTKRADSGRELKMAANFRKDMSSILTECVIKNSDDQKTLPKLEEGISGNERKCPDSTQGRSLPFIKSSMNSNLKPNAMLGNLSPKGSVMSKLDIPVVKGDLKNPGQFHTSSTEKKSTKMPAYSFEFPSLSFDPNGDTGISKYSSVPLRPVRKRSSSFSGMVKTGQDEQTTIDLFCRQKERNQGSQTKEVFILDVCVSTRIWLYLKSIYSTEIDNLTSDLQIKEKIDQENLILCLRGADSEKVNECCHGLKSLIATAERDFDARTLPLSMLGVSDCKDKSLIDFCTAMKAVHEKVKIVVMSKAVMILGPTTACQKVEASMTEVFHIGVSGTKAELEELESWKPHKPSSLEVSTDPFTTNRDSMPLLVTDRPAPTGESAHDIIKTNQPITVDQSYGQVSKTHPLLFQDQTQETIDKQKDTETEQGTEERTQLIAYKGNNSRTHQGDGGMMNKLYVRTENLINFDKEDEDSKVYGEQRIVPTFLQKNTDLDDKSQVKGTEQENLMGSMDQMRDVPQAPGVSRVLGTFLQSSVNRPLSCMCGSQRGTVIKTDCGMKLCSQCLKKNHVNCKFCSTNLDTWGIKGTMSFRESTITLPGFIRDTTLRIVYDIPDGIQGENHPCPGAPFKGSKFEAFLPLNVDTRRLLPLLEKAFHKGLTFTVKAGSSEDPGNEGSGEGEVVWGSIPHKTRLEGGASKNGYPDSTYLRRLAQALRTAGLEE